MIGLNQLHILIKRSRGIRPCEASATSDLIRKVLSPTRQKSWKIRNERVKLALILILRMRAFYMRVHNRRKGEK